MGHTLGSRRDGIRSSRKTIAEKPQDPLAHFHLGELRLEQHNFQFAVDEFREALKVTPHLDWIDAWAHCDIAEILDVTGQRNSALR